MGAGGHTLVSQINRGKHSSSSEQKAGLERSLSEHADVADRGPVDANPSRTGRVAERSLPCPRAPAPHTSDSQGDGSGFQESTPWTQPSPRIQGTSTRRGQSTLGSEGHSAALCLQLRHLSQP